MSAAPAHKLPPAVRDKLGKLLPLLSSNHNGERVGALVAVERVLKGAGLDWHDFTAAITTTPNAPSPSPPRPAAAAPMAMAMVDGELVALVTALRASRRFTARSEQFLDSLIERAERHDVVHLSAKQIRWLDDLALKAKVATP